MLLSVLLIWYSNKLGLLFMKRNWKRNADLLAFNIHWKLSTLVGL